MLISSRESAAGTEYLCKSEGSGFFSSLTCTVVVPSPTRQVPVTTKFLRMERKTVLGGYSACHGLANKPKRSEKRRLQETVFGFS